LRHGVGKKNSGVQKRVRRKLGLLHKKALKTMWKKQGRLLKRNPET